LSVAGEIPLPVLFLYLFHDVEFVLAHNTIW
jgi:hypothetical protein